MPYIPRKQRAAIEKIVIPLGASQLLNKPGQLNFAITMLVLSYLGLVPEHDGWVTEAESSYAAFNEAIGVLECVKQELYRRAVAGYEDKKRSEHGDVFISPATDTGANLCARCRGYAGGSSGVCLMCEIDGER